MVTRQFDMEFRKDGSVHDEDQVSPLLDGLDGLTDLVVLAHGWNNDKADATALYDGFVMSVEEVAAADVVPGAAGRQVGIVRIFWPSKKFADAELIPGGGAASATRASDAALLRLLDELKKDPVVLGGHEVNEARRPHLDRAKELVAQLDSPDAQREYVQCLRAILNPDDAHEDDGSTEFFSEDAQTLFGNLAGPVPVSVAAGSGGATGLGAGGAAGFFGDLVDGVTAAARRVANFATYYQMKTRAGAVGRGGVALVLARVRERKPDLPLHLVGHSFGARLVTAVASHLAAGTPAVSLTLLQAAFSHNGLAEKFDKTHDGAFRTVLQDRRVSGPVLITHTKNDRAVGIAYPLASRIARDVASALGDENDPYGGIGRNGAQRTPEAEGLAGNLGDVGSKYSFRRNKVFNLRADRFISNHSDVTGHQVAYAFLHGLVVSG
jgi:predicted alpha/beta-hydrolase family hydrolase